MDQEQPKLIQVSAQFTTYVIAAGGSGALAQAPSLKPKEQKEICAMPYQKSRNMNKCHFRRDSLTFKGRFVYGLFTNTEKLTAKSVFLQDFRKPSMQLWRHLENWQRTKSISKFA